MGIYKSKETHARNCLSLLLFSCFNLWCQFMLKNWAKESIFTWLKLSTGFIITRWLLLSRLNKILIFERPTRTTKNIWFSNFLGYSICSGPFETGATSIYFQRSVFINSFTFRLNGSRLNVRLYLHLYSCWATTCSLNVCHKHKFYFFSIVRTAYMLILFRLLYASKKSIVILCYIITVYYIASNYIGLLNNMTMIRWTIRTN